MDTIDLQLDANHLTQVPYLSEYAGVWAIEQTAGNHFAQQASRLNIPQHLASPQTAAIKLQAPTADSLIEIHDNVGVVQIRGLMLKHQASMGLATSTVMVRRAIRQLAANDEIESIIIQIESPGGSVAGTLELGQEIAAAARQKRTVAFIDDLGASAAYWAASQASEIFANQAARIGSIGAFTVVSDLSQMAKNEGVKVHVIRAGEFKGRGTPGEALRDEDLAEFQRHIDQSYEFFVQAVADGRGMGKSTVKEIADGRVHLAKDAQDLGLIDGIRSCDELLNEMKQNTNNDNGSNPVSEQATAAADVKSIKANCPGISADKVLEYAEQGKTLEQAKDAWMQELALANEELTEKANELQGKLDEQAEAAKEKEQASLGVEPLEEATGKVATSDAGSATDQFWALVAEYEAKGFSKTKAVSKVGKAHSQLHQEMLAEAKAGLNT